MRIFIFITFLLFANKLIAFSLFDTRFYEIAFNSNNIVEDKKNKISEIKLKSFNLIFTNILISEDYHTLKRKINEDFVNSFIKNIQVEDEKIINNNYTSKVKINFDKKKIINFLRINKLSYVEFLPEKYLIIIYENNKITKNLFSMNNTHYKFLLNNNQKFNFFQLPNIDINDRFLLSIFDMENRNFSNIKKFIKKYNNENIVIVISNELNNKIEYNTLLYIENEIKELDKFIFDIDDYEIFYNHLRFQILDNWKINNFISSTLINSMNCEIKYYNLNELKQIKSNIANVSTIKEINLKSISNRSNLYEVYFYGNNNLLFNLFELNGLKITTTNNFCNILLK